MEVAEVGVLICGTLIRRIAALILERHLSRRSGEESLNTMLTSEESTEEHPCETGDGILRTDLEARFIESQ